MHAFQLFLSVNCDLTNQPVIFNMKQNNRWCTYLRAEESVFQYDETYHDIALLRGIEITKKKKSKAVNVYCYVSKTYHALECNEYSNEWKIKKNSTGISPIFLIL